MARPQLLVFGSAALLGAVWFTHPHHAFEGLADYLPLHSLLETVSIVVSALVFGVVWNAYARERPGNLVILACGFLAVAFLDFVHMLSYPGMPEFVTPADAEKSIFFWLAGRAFAAAALVAAAIRAPVPLADPRSRHALLWGSLAAAAAVCWTGLYRGEHLPRLFVEGEGVTAAKLAAEYALIGAFGIAGLVFYRDARRSSSTEAALLAAAAALSGLSELTLTLYSTVTDALTLLGHLFKVAAYVLIYRAVFVASVREPFERLAERERRLARAERVGRLGSWEVDFVHHRLSYSDEALRIHGLERGAFDGTLAGALALAHPDDRPRLAAAIDATLHQGAPFAIDYRIVRPDGSVRHVHAEDEVERDAARFALRAFGITQDITERKLAEEAQLEGERRLRLLADNVPAMIAYIDAQRRYRYANVRYRAFFASSEAPIDGRDLGQVLTPDTWARVRPRIERALAGEAMSYEDDRRLRDGTLRRVSVSLVPHREDAGPVLGIYILALDVTAQHEAEAALRESEERYRSLVETMAEGVVMLDAEGRCIACNESAARILELPLAQILGRRADEFPLQPLREDGSPSTWLDMPGAVAMATGQPQSARVVGLARPDGRITWSRGSSRPLIRPGAARPHAVVSTFHDITERKAQEERIQRLTRVYAVLSGINAAIVRIRERAELLQEACRIAVEAGGFVMAWAGIVERAAGIVRPIGLHGDDVRGFLEVAPLAILETGPSGQGLAGRAVRESRPVVSNDVAHDPQRLMKKECAERGIQSLAVMPLVVGADVAGVLALYARETGFFDDEEMRLLVELAGDVAFALDHIEKEARVRYLAYYDSITGLANRTLFHERLAQHLAAADREGPGLALVILNIERFKTINDTLGRAAGDALLKEFGERMQRAAGDPALVARVGGDQFAALLLRVKNEENLVSRLERGDAHVKATPFRVAGQELRIATRAGVAVYPQDGTDADTLFRNAEAALKQAQTGEMYVFYKKEMTARVAGKLSLENELRRALEQREFALHYQPKLDLETKRITGVEALIRWASTQRGLVPPGEFIPLLEETGLIVPVGAWVMAQAVADHLRWQRRGLPSVRVAVNVSAIQLRRREFVSAVREALREGAASPGIDLEITESLIMEDVAANIEKLKAVRALGVNIAIDDFGTGYSSLGYLAKLPVQSLKIDRSFVVAMANDPDTMTLVSTIVSLGHALRLKVIAEGVDSEDQAKYLRLLRCDEAQGFLYAKPLPAADLEALLVSQR